MRCGILIISSLVLLLPSCSQKSMEEGVPVKDIPFSSFGRSDRALTKYDKSMNTIVLSDGGHQDCIQSSVSKVLCSEDRILVLDGIQNSVVAYDNNGQAIAKIGIRGRGPQEYVQISDFSVTADSGVVLLDGNKDALLFYDNEYRFSRKQKNRHDFSRLTSVGVDRYLMNISTWDQSGDFDFNVLLCDENQKEIAHFIRNNKQQDPNFEFPYVGFSPADGGKRFFLKPIDDNVYMFAGPELETIYHFDFGAKRIKEEYRSEVEKNMEEISAGTFLINTVWISGDNCIGMLFDKGNFVSFYADMKHKTWTEITDLGYFMGVSDGRAIFYQMDAPGSEGAPVLNMLDIKGITDGRHDH